LLNTYFLIRSYPSVYKRSILPTPSTNHNQIGVDDVYKNRYRLAIILEQPLNGCRCVVVATI
jgi:hypothetical protein